MNKPTLMKLKYTLSDTIKESETSPEPQVGSIRSQEIKP